MRRTDWIRGKFVCWYIVEYETLRVTPVDELDEEQKNFLRLEYGIIICL